MTVMPNDEFAKRMTLLAKPAEQFTPTATYGPGRRLHRVPRQARCVLCRATRRSRGGLLQPADRRSHRFAHQGRVELLRRGAPSHAGFKIEVHDGRMKLEHFFRARLWSAPLDPDAMPALIYEKLIEVAEQSGVETDMPVLEAA